MPRFKLTVEYDGSHYRGWQFQREVPTVMGKLMDAVKEVYKKTDYELYGSGRTDAGVHALGQVIHYDYPAMIPPERMQQALNSLTTDEIAIVKVEIVDDVKNPCPECGEALSRGEGCYTCLNCGYSKCS